MSPTSVFSAAERGGGRICVWVDYLDNYIQVNKKELADLVERQGCAFLLNADAYTDKGCLYIKGKS